MNSIQLVGRAGSEPDLKTLNDGENRVAKVSMAISGWKKGEKTTSWIQIETWNKSADTLKNYVKKGDQFGIVGRIEEQKWQTESGQERSKLIVIADRIELLSNKETTTVSTATKAISEGQPDDGMPF